MRHVLVGITIAVGASIMGAGIAASDTGTQQHVAKAAVVAPIPKHIPKPGPKLSTPPPPKPKPAYILETKPFFASYFWDDGSGINGDTGAPASGKPMQKGLVASPMWPLGTVLVVSANGRSRTVFVGDFGPGVPAERSYNPELLDLDTWTFRYLVDGGTPPSNYDAGVAAGDIEITAKIVKWGTGGSFQGRSPYWRASDWRK